MVVRFPAKENAGCPDAQFPAKIVQELLLHFTSPYMKCVYGWAGVRYVITKFSRVDSLPNFVTHGAPLALALRARELR